MKGIPFQAIDWASLPTTTKPGLSGTVSWQTANFDGLRIRIVAYSPGYLADHWCEKGHIVYCLEGSFTSEQQHGTPVLLSAGMSYIVSDDLSSHRSRTETGARMLIIDGDFLKLPDKN